MSVRPIRPNDVPAVVGLVRELAEYEKAAHEVRLTEEQLHASLFGEHPALFGHVAVVSEDGVAPGVVVGTALWFLNFSTWRGTHGIYLEDLYVQPGHRGGGLGRELLRTLAETCVQRGYNRLEWAVLDWNAPSIAFYESLGARPRSDWIVYRLTEGPLAALAKLEENACSS